MRIAGLTGGIGMGKSTVAEWFRQQAIPVADTDAIARQVVEPGTPALAAIVAAFGQAVIGPDGRLRRDELAARVFADANARRQLETIVHPQIRSVWQAQADAWRAADHALGVIVIPLLFETNADPCFDAIICVACSPATQRRRLQARGLDHLQIERRNQAQWPVDQKMSGADYVIWTEGNLEVMAQQLEWILPRLVEPGSNT